MNVKNLVPYCHLAALLVETEPKELVIPSPARQALPSMPEVGVRAATRLRTKTTLMEILTLPFIA